MEWPNNPGLLYHVQLKLRVTGRVSFWKIIACRGHRIQCEKTKQSKNLYGTIKLRKERLQKDYLSSVSSEYKLIEIL